MKRGMTKRVVLSGGTARSSFPAGSGARIGVERRGGESFRLGMLAAFTAAACSSTTAPPPPPPPPSPSLGVELVTARVSDPVYLTAPAGDPRLFIVEQGGRIRIIDGGGSLLPTPFLDLSGTVSGGNEQGLLGLAFHPDYAMNGFFYVNYTDGAGDTRVERYTATGNPATSNTANAGSAKVILGVPQPRSNHNAGQLFFDAAGLLYIPLGDGGGSGDPDDNGQDPTTLLGSLLRIDVDGGDPYAIPAGNPGIGNAGLLDEIWAIGLRNPWRSWIDEPTGTLFIADVGQNRIEEVNAVALSAAGLNYGWNTMEGSECFGGSCNPAGLTLPAVEYPHPQGCSVTGGAVYRGSGIPGVVGHYFYSDFCTGFLRSFRFENGQVVDQQNWQTAPLGRVTSFGVDSAGELYVLDGNGRVLRLVEPLAP